MCESTDHFKECIGLNASTRALIPTHEGADNEPDKIQKLSTILKKFHDVSKYLQYDDDDKISVYRDRFYFNKLKTQHPEIDIYLSDDGINVHNIDFENVIAKIQRAKVNNDATVDLARKEKEAVQFFLIGNEEQADSEAEEIERSFEDIADEEFKQQVKKKEQKRIPLQIYRPCCSNFSHCRKVIKQMRNHHASSQKIDGSLIDGDSNYATF